MRLMRMSIIAALALSLWLPAVQADAQQTGPFRVYLTFEDGPTDWYTPGILDILAQYNAKATFFVNGYQIAGREWILQRILSEGHALGNHLWVEEGHYSGASDDVIRELYLRTEDAIRAALGGTLPIYEAQTKLYRTPGGGAKPFPATKGVNVISYNWHVSGNDCGSAIDWESDLSFDAQVLRNILENPLGFNVWDYGDGVVIVLHDINRVTERILPTLMGRLQAAGATFYALPRPEDLINTMPIILGTPPSAGPGYAGTHLTGVALDYVHFRATPDPNAALLTDSIPVNTRLTVIGRSDGWYQVEYNTWVGWVAADYIQIDGPIPNLPLEITP